jgi:hypothetical protein
MSVNAILYEREQEPEFFAKKCSGCRKPCQCCCCEERCGWGSCDQCGECDSESSNDGSNK